MTAVRTGLQDRGLHQRADRLPSLESGAPTSNSGAARADLVCSSSRTTTSSRAATSVGIRSSLRMAKKVR
ncbi:hypothetical protein NKH18_05555 [Streptomyces sp. M10(2022)]